MESQRRGWGNEGKFLRGDAQEESLRISKSQSSIGRKLFPEHFGNCESKRYLWELKTELRLAHISENKLFSDRYKM